MKLDFNGNWKFWTDDKNKISVCLPHDAMQHSKRSKTALSGGAGAYFEGGIYTYEKTFAAPEEWARKALYLEFGGVYRNSKIYINDTLAGEWAYGYSKFYVEITQYLKIGAENTVKVIADNSAQPNSRWYAGGGIYRPVHLIVKNKEHFELDGISVKTVSLNPAKIAVKAAYSGGNAEYVVIYKGNTVATASGESVEIEVPNAKLWSAEEPNLYMLKAVLKNGDEVCDIEEIIFGIRMLEWSTKGFFVNGKNVKLRGGCVHHDNGILGARSYPEAEERRVRIIKDAGYNALRSSHNPMSEDMISACDKLGMYVIDETFDMWYMRKNKCDYALDFEKWHDKDIFQMVQRDKNHPSVIMYSIANEVSEPYSEKGLKTGKSMVDYIRSLDDTRPITGGFNLMVMNNASKGKGIYKEDGGRNRKPSKKQKPTSSTLFNMIANMVGTLMNRFAGSKGADRVSAPMLDYLDIVGYNYGSGRYYKDRKDHPERICFGSETFPQDIVKNWKAVTELPYCIGDFMWTAWDYLGEVGLGAWTTEKVIGFSLEKPYPWLLSQSGAIDVIGTVGAEAKLAATVWGLEEKPYIGVRPCNHPHEKINKMVWRGTNAIDSWSWENCDGNKVEIEVYSTAEQIELMLNGKSFGKRKVKGYIAKFKTKYVPGTLEAVAYSNGKEITRTALRSATGKTQLEAYFEEDKLKVGQIAFVDIALTGANGIVRANCDEEVTVSVENGELLALGSAQPKSERSYLDGTYKTYYGKALAAIKATNKGTIKVTVKTKTFQSQATIEVE